jgi:hypothetical protein
MIRTLILDYFCFARPDFPALNLMPVVPDLVKQFVGRIYDFRKTLCFFDPFLFHHRSASCVGSIAAVLRQIDKIERLDDAQKSSPIG